MKNKKQNFGNGRKKLKKEKKPLKVSGRFRSIGSTDKRFFSIDPDLANAAKTKEKPRSRDPDCSVFASLAAPSGRGGDHATGDPGAMVRGGWSFEDGFASEAQPDLVNKLQQQAIADGNLDLAVVLDAGSTRVFEMLIAQEPDAAALGNVRPWTLPSSIVGTRDQGYKAHGRAELVGSKPTTPLFHAVCLLVFRVDKVLRSRFGLEQSPGLVTRRFSIRPGRKNTTGLS